MHQPCLPHMCTKKISQLRLVAFPWYHTHPFCVNTFRDVIHLYRKADIQSLAYSMRNQHFLHIITFIIHNNYIYHNTIVF